MPNTRWDDDEYDDAGEIIYMGQDDIEQSEEVKALHNKFKSLKQIYTTDIFDDLIDNEYADYEDLGHLIIDMKILTAEDREELLQLMYDVHDMESLYD